MNKKNEFKPNNIINKKYKFREILIALCMPLYDYRYLNPFNFMDRLWVIHNFTDYYKVKAPILNAAKHCAIYWGDFFDCYLVPDVDGLEEIGRYYRV